MALYTKFFEILYIDIFRSNRCGSQNKNSSNVYLLDVPHKHQQQPAANLQLNIRLTTTFDISILCRKVSCLIPRILERIYYTTREPDEAFFAYLNPILFLIFPMHSVSQVPCYFTEVLFLWTKSVQFDTVLVTMASQHFTVPLRSMTSLFKVSRL